MSGSGQVTQTSAAGWDSYFLNLRQSSSGISVSPEKATSLMAYFACLRVRAEDLAKFPVRVFRKRDDFKEDLNDHTVKRLLNYEVNHYMSSITWKELMCFWCDGWGDGVSEIEFDSSGNPIALWPIHPSRLDIKKVKDEIFYIVRNEDTSQIALTHDRVFHLRGLGDEVRGWSIAKLAAESIGAGIAVQRYGAEFFGNGAMHGIAIVHPNKLKPEALERYRQSWAEAHQGPGNFHRTAIFDDGIKAERLSIPPNEAQFLETRKFTIEEMCGWCRVNPNKIQHYDQMPYNSVEAAQLDHITDTMMPIINRFECEVKRKLLFEDDEYVRVIVEAVLRGDMAAQTSHFNAMLDRGVYSVNDVLILLDRNPVEGGEIRRVQGNTTPATNQEIPQTHTPPAKPPSMPVDKRRRMMATNVVFACASILRKEVVATSKQLDKKPEEFQTWFREFREEERNEIALTIRHYLERVYSIDDSCEAWSIDDCDFVSGVIASAYISSTHTTILDDASKRLFDICSFIFSATINDKEIKNANVA